MAGQTVTLDQLVQQAGFTGQSAAIMAAIVMAESGGNPTAHNAVPPDNSYGLAQINMIGGLEQARLQEFHLSSDADLYNPLTNLQVAYTLSKNGTDFSPWSTYNDGDYQQYMGKTGNVTESLSNVTGSSTSTVGDPVPPYDPATLHVPLSSAQKGAMNSWYVKMCARHSPDSPQQSITLMGMSDEQALATYTQIYNEYKAGSVPPITGTPVQGGGLGDSDNPSASWFSDIGNVLSKFTSVAFWKRLGLGVLGVVIIAVAIIFAVGGDIPGVSSG